MFVFYSEAAGTYWVMPSLDLVKEATCNKEGINAGNTRWCLPIREKMEDLIHPRFDTWRDNWDAFGAMARKLAP
jgi:hypothetical protein